MTIYAVVVACVAALAGIAIGYYFRKVVGARSAKSLEKKIENKIKTAKEKIGKLREEAETETREIRKQGEQELDERRAQLVNLEKNVATREKRLDEKLSDLEKREDSINNSQKEMGKKQARLQKLISGEEKKLEEISGLTSKQAEERMLEIAEEKTKEDVVRRIRKLEKEGAKQWEDRARDLLAMVVQRYAASQVSETMSTHVYVEDENLIGRVIGKEGRNIQHLERMTGCEIIIDETPNSIMVSSFSPIRRQVAKTAIEKLLADGRIHPGRIEEVVNEAKKTVNADIMEAGEAVVYDLGIMGLPDNLIQLIGRLKYRSSYRQNVLKHSLEAAHIGSMLAEELGADVNVVKKAALLHDVGKAIDHEVKGDHVEIGVKILKKFGVDERVIEAAASHHEDYPFATLEALIVQVADAISASRPGARRDTSENYVKRMEDLENIACSYEGVERAYAIYAGREVRVFVQPKEVDDLKAIKLAQDIARQIEQDLTYPGEIKVNVIRETRSDTKAH